MGIHHAADRPLGGTKELIKKGDEFTLNMELIVAGKPVFGNVHAPEPAVEIAIIYLLGR